MTATGEITTAGALLVFAPCLAACSGVPGLFLKTTSSLGQKIGTLLLLLASLAGLGGAVAIVAGERTEAITLDWGLPLGPCELGVDPLAALFLLPVFLISACSTLYGTGYWPAAANPRTTRKLTFFTGLLSSSLALLVLARNGIIFLMAWEVMALACYFVMTAEDHLPEVREAGTLYIITTHLGTLALFAMFSLLRADAASFTFPAAGSLDATLPLASGIFVTALLGFGLKAGLMPLHIWLPSAHANAPSHISALMSGVLIKMGIYGLVRVLSFYDKVPLWWGVTLLVAGIVSGVAGVAFAIGQHDLKRLLAYHSIENIGIIAMGIGVALIGRAIASPLLVMLGMAGALLHVLNHAIFKSLLFLAAGAVLHGAGTREIDRLGGLARRLPWSAALFLTGAVAICGLPPLNGFVSELLIYLGFFSGIRVTDGTPLPFLALAAPALALVGGLAVACFVKVYGAVFLGQPRSAAAGAAHEAGWAMRLPMVLLGLLCFAIGIAPAGVAPLLERALHAWQPALAQGGTRLSAVAPFGWLTIFAVLFLVAAGALGAVFRRRLRSAPYGTAATWGCGYLNPSPRMQYSASSFAEMLVKLFTGVLRPHWQRPAISGPAPASGHFASHVPEVALEMVFLPFLRRAFEKLAVVRRLQHGQLHLYILYTFITLVLLLLWVQ